MPSVGVAAFIFRICVNLFFSGTLGLVCWAFGRLVLLSFFIPTPTTDRIMAIIAISLGAGFGGSVGNFMLELPARSLWTRFLIALAVTFIGSWLGLQYGKTVYIMSGMPGIPELRGIVTGAMIAANAVPVILNIVTIIRGRRRPESVPPSIRDRYRHPSS